MLITAFVVTNGYERFLPDAALGEPTRSRSNPASSTTAVTPINTRS
jgi:hypothetical protein